MVAGWYTLSHTGGVIYSMRAGYAFLAGGGEFSPDGKLNVVGGDFDTIYGQSFPLMHPHLTLITKLVLDQADFGRDHTLRISLLDAQGKRVGQDLQGPIQVPGKVPRPDRPTGIGFALEAISLTFPSPGEYIWHIYVDDVEIVALPLYVEKRLQP